ncbi:MAG: hypothetical protein EA363_05010 [Balneolaceae bacterium]|nr:MAG: hypothetical protein EA363_05010 [Balneolaceae bacterium]
MKNVKKLRNSYLAVSLLVSVAVTVSGVFVFFYLLGMTGEEAIGLLEVVGMLIFVLLLFIIGVGIGGWFWAFIAKVFFGLTLKEVYAMLFDKQPDIPVITAYNLWCLKILYRDKESLELLELLRKKHQS